MTTSKIQLMKPVLCNIFARFFVLLFCLPVGGAGCKGKQPDTTITGSGGATKTSSEMSKKKAEPAPSPAADAATISKRPQVPILCYHQIRNFRPTDSKRAKDYIVPEDNFRQQMKILADSGYHTILPDQLYDYLAHGTPLPAKPIMLTFDDTDLDQFALAWPEMKQYGFRGVFFIMTVSLGRPGYMSRDQVKQLSDEGNVIGSHTWNHSNVKKYTEKDWVIQVEKPSHLLETITGKPIRYFAYPFGLWNKEAIAGLKKYDFKAVFQLSEKRDDQDPLYTVRRMIVPGSWSAPGMLSVMKRTF